jgi:hypothetical protein
MASKKDWRNASINFLLLKWEARSRRRKSRGHGQESGVLRGVFNLGGTRPEREPSKLEAERLLRRLRANPSVASINVVYWDEVVHMEKVRDEISK